MLTIDLPRQPQHQFRKDHAQGQAHRLQKQKRNGGTVDLRHGDLGQEDFLTLMIAQFRNQDPFEPMDNGEFLGQLAQFGTVDGIDRLNGAFGQLTSSLTTDQALQASNLVGHDVLADTDRGYMPAGGNVEGAIELGSSAENVQIDINDASGQLVQRLNLGIQPAGLVNFAWDGTTERGGRAAAGEYTITARAIRGLSVESTPTLIEADIESVSLGRYGQGMTLNLAGGSILSMNQVRRIL